MKIQDIKNGQIVELRNGRKLYRCGDYFVNDNERLRIKSYDKWNTFNERKIL